MLRMIVVPLLLALLHTLAANPPTLADRRGQDPSAAVTRAALMSFYDSCAGAGWTNRSGWGSHSAFCSWYGVRCSTNTTQVSALELSSNRLSGSLTTEMAALGQLIHVNLRTYGPRVGYRETDANQISGTIPAAALQIPGIKFTARGNKLSGTIHPIPTIAKLSLSLNHFSGTVPPELFSDGFQNFSIASNPISGWLPETISSPVNLVAFNILSTQLSGSLPAELSQLTTIETLGINDNWISGLIPAAVGSLSLIKQIYLNSNCLSGTMPNLERLLILETCYINSNNCIDVASPSKNAHPSLGISGTLPKLVETSMNGLVVSHNHLSGTVSHKLSRATGMLIFDIAQNLISGTSASGWSNWTQLSFFSIFGNRELDMDLQLLKHWSKVRDVMAHNCRVRGTFPEAPLSRLGRINSVLVQGNEISGTISPNLFINASANWRLDMVIMTGNRLSGTLPSTLQFSKLKSLKISDMQISGTLPPWQHQPPPPLNDSSRNLEQNLQILVLSRNYLQGSTSALDGFSVLKTLIITSNHFSCDVADLHNNEVLGQGTFNDPVTSRLSATGRYMAQNFPFLDPYEDTNHVLSYPATVMAYSGNAMYTSASYITNTHVGKVLRHDAIKQGAKGLFPQNTRLWQFTLLTLLPLAICFSLVVMLVVKKEEFRKYFGLSSSSCRTQLDETSSNSHIALLCVSFRGVLGLSVCGVCFIVLNLASDGLYDQHGCIDPLLRLSCVNSLAEPYWQWVWVIISCCTMTTVDYLLEMTRRNSRDKTEHAVAVYNTTHSLLLRLSRTSVRTTIVNWKATMHSESGRLSIRQQPVTPATSNWLYLAILAPLLVFASLPSVLYILAKNVPENASIWYFLLGSPLTLAIVKQLVNTYLVPPTGAWLARLRYGIKRDTLIRSDVAVPYFCAQVSISLLFDVVTVLLSPMVTTFVLDESCLRQYLYFAGSTTTLMDQWGIGTRGIEAYRSGFCFRSMLREFHYVWLAILLLYAFVNPILRLARPWIEGVRTKLGSLQARCRGAENAKDTTTPYEQTLDRSRILQEEMVNSISNMMVVVVFGSVVPLLSLIAPVAIWLNLNALRWESEHTEASIGEKVAANFFLQQPWSTCAVMAHLGQWGVAFCLFIDYRFEAGPIVFWALFTVAKLAVSQFCTSRQSALRDVKNRAIEYCKSKTNQTSDGHSEDDEDEQPPSSPRMQHDEIQIELSPVVATSSEEKRAKTIELVQFRRQGLMKPDLGQDPIKSPVGRRFKNSKLPISEGRAPISPKAQIASAQQSSRAKGTNRTKTNPTGSRPVHGEDNRSPRSTAADSISTTSASGAEFNSEDAQAATIARIKRTRQGRLSEARLLQQQRQQSWLHESSEQRVESSNPLKSPTAKQSCDPGPDVLEINPAARDQMEVLWAKDEPPSGIEVQLSGGAKAGDRPLPSGIVAIASKSRPGEVSYLVEVSGEKYKTLKKAIDSKTKSYDPKPSTVSPTIRV